MKKVFYLLTIIIVCACANNQANKSDSNNDLTMFNIVFADSFLETNNLKQTSLNAEDLFNIKKIEKLGIILNNKQKTELLTGIINFPKDEYNAIFAYIIQIYDSIVSVCFLIQYSDIEDIYIVNYSSQNKIISHLYSGQIDSSDLIIQEENKEVYYNEQNYFSFEQNNIALFKKYEEITHFFDTDIKNITYKDSIVKHYSIDLQGNFILSKTDSISSGKKFYFE